jgi:hypothetical protein
MGDCAQVHTVQRVKVAPMNGDPFSTDLKFLNLADGVDEQHVALCMEPQSLAAACDLAARIHRDKHYLDSACYVVGPDDAEICKIGVAGHPIKRLDGLQCGNWHDLKIHGLCWFESGSVVAEQTALAAAKEMGISVRGEWVMAAPRDAVELVLKAARYKALKCADSGAWLNNWSTRVEVLPV